ncbi:hypothetical protein BDK51DRAFT_48184 [Blyttiomyces helicus]|uniref:F-box domain-containing protein n=1 Tax=Blyttiomyces helicus TaxID=388810 RepID=A0A4P9VVN5_9FUNG|nr:hypothetical protein BDK51DRAFT_48184 [Blyttiomyces helicus]|eukprot:RKO83721.1 hypothetical protein BDK51DRAFT_48184 [Blyttiomyces helicus]
MDQRDAVAGETMVVFGNARRLHSLEDGGEQRIGYDAHGMDDGIEEHPVLFPNAPNLAQRSVCGSAAGQRGDGNPRSPPTTPPTASPSPIRDPPQDPRKPVRQPALLPSLLPRHPLLRVRAAALVCRRWELAASERLWTHVSLSARARKVYEGLRECNPPARKPHRAPRDHGVKPEPGNQKWQWLEPELPPPPIRVTTAVIGTALVSCPNLVVLESNAPSTAPEISETREAGEGDPDFVDREAIARGVKRLKCLRLYASPFSYKGDIGSEFLSLLIESVGVSLIEFKLGGRRYVTRPRFAAALPNLQVLQLWTGEIGFFTT